MATFAFAPAAQAAGPRYRIVNMRHNLCLDGNVPTGGVYVWTCVNASNQYWYFDFINANFARIRNAKTGKCLGVQGGVHYSAPIISGPCGDSWDAWWEGFNRVGQSTHWYQLAPYYLRYRYCIDAPSFQVGSAVYSNGCQVYSVTHPPPTDYWTWQPV
jgi:hypothetical protein